MTALISALKEKTLGNIFRGTSLITLKRKVGTADRVIERAEMFGLRDFDPGEIND